MYFARCLDILQSIALLLRHPDSRLWFDYVTRDLLTGETIPRAAAFIDAMQKMGEPFRHGFLSEAPGCSLSAAIISDHPASPSRPT